MLYRSTIIFVRIEPSSSTPIYRQIIDQIRYQIVSGALKTDEKLPSVRELAIDLAVNQNTVLKVYNELSREDLVRMERGDGTYVCSKKPKISVAERKKIVAELLRPGVIQAVQLELSPEQTQGILTSEYEEINKRRAKT